MDIRTVAIALVGYIYYFWVSNYFHFHFLLLNSATVMVSFWYSCLKWQLLKKIPEHKKTFIKRISDVFEMNWHQLRQCFAQLLLIIKVYLLSKSESIK